MEELELVEDATALAKAIAACAVDEGLPLPSGGRTLRLVASILARFESLVASARLDEATEAALRRESERAVLVIESLAELCSSILLQLSERGVVIRNLPEFLASPYLLPEVGVVPEVDPLPEVD
ncbi:MAG: hypothetical protein JO368_04480 [Acidimicrobiales bacterium]|nr:hypothetical protein [Acidimicrobiales bacterium]